MIKKSSVIFLLIFFLGLIVPIANTYAQSIPTNEVDAQKYYQEIQKSKLITTEEKDKIEQGIDELEDATFIDEDLTKAENQVIDESIIANENTNKLELKLDNQDKEVLDDSTVKEVNSYVEETNQELKDGDFYINSEGEVVASKESGDYTLQKGSTKIVKTRHGYKVFLSSYVCKAIIAGVSYGATTACGVFSAGTAVAICYAAAGAVIYASNYYVKKGVIVTLNKNKKSIGIARQ